MKWTDESDRAPEPELVDLDAWRAEAGEAPTLDAVATRGPWRYVPGVALKHYVASDDDDFGISLQSMHWKDGRDVPAEANARFIAAARLGWPRDAARVSALCAEVARLRARVAAWRAHQLAALDYVPHPASIEDRCALEKRREAAWAEVMRVDPGWEREAEEAARREGAER